MDGPFRNRFLQVVPALADPEGMVLPPRARVAQRTAGVPALDPSGPVPTALPAAADFSRDGQDIDGAAYFMVGFDLARGSSNQILRDVRDELRVPDSAFIWSPGILERAATMARARDVAVQLPAAVSDTTATVPADWLRVCLWLTYSTTPVPLIAVRLPTLVTLPAMGGEAWNPANGPVRAYQGFDPQLLAQNPFARAYSDPVDYTEVDSDGDSDSGSGSGSGSGGLLLVGVGLAALLLLGGRK